jgi:hypothetical protein
MWTLVFRAWGTRVSLGLLAACLSGAPIWAAEPAAATSEEGQSAVWTQKELTFVYLGFTSRYSCDGFRDKVESALLQLGARKKDLKVSEWGCVSDFGRPDPFPGVKVKMSVLQPARSDDKQPPVAAHWKQVDVRIDDYRAPDSGNCELVEQIHSSIVPLFTTRNVDFKTNCIPHQATVGGTTLKLEVLQADRKETEPPVAAR